jgi:hypothetical protein
MPLSTKIVLPLLLAAIVSAYGFVRPSAAVPEPESHLRGDVYTLPETFFVEFRSGGSAMLSVGVVLERGDAEQTDGDGLAALPRGYSTPVQKALVRSVVTKTVAAGSARALKRVRGRLAVRRQLRSRLRAKTDLPVISVLITDILVSDKHAARRP